MLVLRFLGQFEVLREGLRVSIPTRNAQSLLAFLALNAGKPQRRERLAGLLWPDSSEDNARSNLRHELWRLRKALEREGEAYFEIDDLSLTFQPRGEYRLDVQQLERAPVEDSSAADLTEALSAYGGELLPGFYDEWVLVERERLHALAEAKISRLLELLQSEGRWAEVLEWGQFWIAWGQWPEPAYRALMAVYASRGELSRAAATYERLAQGLQKDLHIKPSEQTQALFKRIQAGWKVSAEEQRITTAAQKTGSPVTGPAPPAPRARRTNLPRPLTSFIGREKEIRQVQELLPTARLVTITGSGGVGKTRLAIQAASGLEPQFPDGIWWVELAGLSDIARLAASAKAVEQGASGVREADRELADGNLILQAVAKVVRVPETPGEPLLEGLLEHLHGQQLLLALDNCEHLIEACAALAEHILVGCPEVSILATSREALGVPGERAWPLAPLSLPEGDLASNQAQIFQSEAVRLFVERAGEVLPGYQPGEREAPVIAQICQRLNGIPLSIELAAARMNLLTAQEIAARLDHRFSLLTGGRRTALPRHQTLQAAIEWSYDLLGEIERVLFRRLTVFSGSFTLEAAEAVSAAEGVRADQVLTLLGRLVDKSLLTVEPGPPDTGLATRYRFLDTICSFGRMKLEEAEEMSRLRSRHAAYFVRLVETAEAELRLPNQGSWYRLLQAEKDNIRAAIEWCVENGQVENGLRLVGSLLWFWWSHGSSHEGLALALKVLAHPASARHPVYRGMALNTAGYLHWVLGDVASARRKIEEALSLLSQAAHEASRAWAMQLLGLVLTTEGEYDLADEAMKEGLAIARKLGDLTKSSFSLAFLGDIALKQGDRGKAKGVYEECAGQLRELGNKLFLAYPLRRLGYLALERSDLAQAGAYFVESLQLNREGGDKRAIAACLTSLAVLAAHRNQPRLAARLCGAAEHQLEALSMNLFSLDQVEMDRIRKELSISLGEAMFQPAFNEGWEMSEEAAIELAEEIGKKTHEGKGIHYGSEETASGHSR